MEELKFLNYKPLGQIIITKCIKIFKDLVHNCCTYSINNLVLLVNKNNYLIFIILFLQAY